MGLRLGQPAESAPGRLEESHSSVEEAVKLSTNGKIIVVVELYVALSGVPQFHWCSLK